MGLKLTPQPTPAYHATIRGFSCDKYPEYVEGSVGSAVAKFVDDVIFIFGLDSHTLIKVRTSQERGLGYR